MHLSQLQQSSLSQSALSLRSPLDGSGNKSNAPQLLMAKYLGLCQCIETLQHQATVSNNYSFAIKLHNKITQTNQPNILKRILKSFENIHLRRTNILHYHQRLFHLILTKQQWLCSQSIQRAKMFNRLSERLAFHRV